MSLGSCHDPGPHRPGQRQRQHWALSREPVCPVPPRPVGVFVSHDGCVPSTPITSSNLLLPEAKPCRLVPECSPTPQGHVHRPYCALWAPCVPILSFVSESILLWHLPEEKPGFLLPMRLLSLVKPALSCTFTRVRGRGWGWGRVWGRGRGLSTRQSPSPTSPPCS